MASFSRSSLKHMLQQRSKVTHQLRASLFSTSTIVSEEVREFSTASQALQSIQHQYSETDLLRMKKHAKADLVQALENIIDVQRALGVSSGLMVSGDTDEHINLKDEVDSWTSSINAALKDKQFSRAVDMFYRSPKSVSDSSESSVLFSLRNLMNRVPAGDDKTIFDMYEVGEKIYANAIEHADEDTAVRIDHHRHAMLKKVIKTISLGPRSIPYPRLSQALKELASTIECITEPHIQHGLYPLLMKAMLNKPMAIQVGKSIALQAFERDLWESALYSLRMMDRNLVSDYPKNFQLYQNVLAQSSFRKQKGLPFVFVMKTLVDKGEATTNNHIFF
jgi:hypothetical protein